MAGSVMPMQADRAEGQGHRLDLAVLALEGHSQSGTALAHVGGAGQRQPEGQAVLGQLAQVDDGVHVVDAGHNGDGVQAAHHKGTDAEGQGDQSLDTADDAVLNGG